MTPLPRAPWRAWSIPLLLALLAARAGAETALDLTDRIVIDGFTGEFVDGESVFGFNDEAGVPEESVTDSEWGAFNDVNQVRITWDAENLYVTVDGTIFDNNTILLLDITDRAPQTATDDGLDKMTELNAWRRNFVFSPDFTPDLFVATWDQNTLPQIWTYTGPDNIVQISSEQYLAQATFDQSAAGRAMEAAIPWPIVFDGQSTQVKSAELGGASVWQIPAGMDTLKLAAVVTAGPDGTGGPDSAPDNFGGHTVESSDQVTIDNFAWLPLDTDDVEGVPDFGIEPKSRIGFKQRPPISGVTYEITDLVLSRPIVSPDENLDLAFELVLDPPSSSAETFREVKLSASVFDLLGNEVDVIYTESVRPAASPGMPMLDRWDGRDASGRPLPGGIYVLSVVSEPGLSRAKKAFSVVR